MHCSFKNILAYETRQKFLAAVRARWRVVPLTCREISSRAHDVFPEGLKVTQENFLQRVILGSQNARERLALGVGWPGRGNRVGSRAGRQSLGPFRSSTDIPSVFSGEVFALLSLATFL